MLCGRVLRENLAETSFQHLLAGVQFLGKAQTMYLPKTKNTAKLAEPQLQSLELQKLDSSGQSSPRCGFHNRLPVSQFHVHVRYQSQLWSPHLSKR